MRTIQTCRPGSIKKEVFWHQHYEKQKTSGLNRAKYCRQEGLHDRQFGYWARRFDKKGQGEKLVSVKIKTSPLPPACAIPLILCTLNLKSGHCLKIHDVNALSLILDRMS